MRQIVLDTETTGLELDGGHRIIEIGCVELIGRRRTFNDFHMYLWPDREIDAGAQAVHGISLRDLEGKPRFADIADEFIAYIDQAELIIHNAAYDAAIINQEFDRLPNKGAVADYCSVLDSLLMARRMHPGQSNKLDSLCKRYFIDNSNRTLHGALLDAELTAEVYLAMTGGQVTLALDQQGEAGSNAVGKRKVQRAGLKLQVTKATAAELQTHADYLASLPQPDEGPLNW